MSATFEIPKSTSTTSKPLWAAVGVLGVAVLAMGATLIHIQNRPEEPRLAVLAAAPTETVALASAPVDGGKISTSKKALAPVDHTQAATKSVANETGQSVGTTAAVNHPVVQVGKPICAHCGTVASVTPIQRDGTAGGGGAIAGGVLGAVVGNQIGGGNGKTLATILGAVGGGFAGNTVEKKMKKETVYQVRVHMEDGSTHRVEQTTPATVGAKVIVEGNTLRPASR